MFFGAVRTQLFSSLQRDVRQETLLAALIQCDSATSFARSLAHSPDSLAISTGDLDRQGDSLQTSVELRQASRRKVSCAISRLLAERRVSEQANKRAAF